MRSVCSGRGASPRSDAPAHYAVTTRFEPVASSLTGTRAVTHARARKAGFEPTDTRIRAPLARQSPLPIECVPEGSNFRPAGLHSAALPAELGTRSRPDGAGQRRPGCTDSAGRVVQTHSGVDRLNTRLPMQLSKQSDKESNLARLGLESGPPPRSLLLGAYGSRVSVRRMIRTCPARRPGYSPRSRAG